MSMSVNARQYIEKVRTEVDVNSNPINAILEAINNDAELNFGQQEFVREMIVQIHGSMKDGMFEDYGMSVMVLATYINSCK